VADPNDYQLGDTDNNIFRKILNRLSAFMGGGSPTVTLTASDVEIGAVEIKNSTPTAGSGVIFALVIPANSGANVFNAIGIPFATGIAITTVTEIADAGTTAVAVDDLNINIWYK